MKLKRILILLLFFNTMVFMISCDKENIKKENRVNIEKNDKDNKNKELVNEKENNNENINEEDKGENSKDKNLKEKIEGLDKDKEIESNKGSKEGSKEEDNLIQNFIISGGSNIVEGICEYYLYGIGVKSRISPSIITTNSSYYEIDSNINTYVDITLFVNNLSSEAKIAEDLIKVKIKINNVEYQCFSILESFDETYLEKDVLINPQESRKIHYLAEVPVVDAKGEVEIILIIDGKEFSNKLSL